jgi:ferritin-like metal-binding protein YciE
MSNDTKSKIVQFLEEARATELALVQTLQAHIAMTPRGPYRELLERHLDETRKHASKIERRLDQLGGASSSPVETVVSAVERVAIRAGALAKAPLDVVRGTSGEEKLLKNVRDEIASEQLEIATYLALEQAATVVGDGPTAKLAADIRADEERTRDALLEILPAVAEAAIMAEAGVETYDIAATGAADAARGVAKEAKKTARGAARSTQSKARKTASKAERSAKDAGKSAETTAKDAARTADRKVTGGDEPWPGYDDATVEDVSKRLERGDTRLAEKVRDYERHNKDRQGVLEATERELAGSRG